MSRTKIDRTKIDLTRFENQAIDVGDGQSLRKREKAALCQRLSFLSNDLLTNVVDFFYP
jgi:hypothetical protein